MVQEAKELAKILGAIIKQKQSKSRKLRRTQQRALLYNGFRPLERHYVALESRSREATLCSFYKGAARSALSFCFYRSAALSPRGVLESRI